ncbi:hypothetical protein PPACK8108_LOCUS19025 [Phakopsora pachyrhizi]|uniref:Uncharacterized protein n=1 Tax=Phakopsora pachyrhizi TaxID=170000 RepID=A0AAV0BDQ4_PHAPC|nr:hypothetical protein PPACK8108_LOCUS19025 [Phakopsora pachyrhizi]
MNYNFDSEVHYEMDPNTFQVIQNISILVQKAMRELSGEEPYLDKNNELVEQQQEQLQQQQQQQQPPDPNCIPRLFSKIHLTLTKRSNLRIKNRNKGGALPWPDPSTGGFVGKRNGLLLDQALLNAIKMERFKKENKYLRELLGISGDFDHQNGSSNELSLLRTRGRESNGVGGAEGARDDEQELHLAKLNSGVSEVIKEKEEEEEEEEKEDDNEDEHLEEQHEGPYYLKEEENIKISNKHGDENDQTHLDQDLSPLSSSHDPNFENNQPKGKNQSNSTNFTITLTLP